MNLPAGMTASDAIDIVGMLLRFILQILEVVI